MNLMSTLFPVFNVKIWARSWKQRGTEAKVFDINVENPPPQFLSEPGLFLDILVTPPWNPYLFYSFP